MHCCVAGCRPTARAVKECCARRRRLAGSVVVPWLPVRAHPRWLQSLTRPLSVLDEQTQQRSTTNLATIGVKRVSLRSEVTPI